LFDPVIDGGVRNPNWFEGRLLTAEAMREKDRAERLRERLLGRAIGAGIFEGLMVTLGGADSSGVTRTLNITKGAAMSQQGELLLLSKDVTVDVVPQTTPPEAEPTLFARCPQASPATIPSGFGIYVLLLAPASAYRERAPKSGLGNEGVVTGCGDAFAVDGVRFRMEKLDPTTISGIDGTARDELNQLILGSSDAAKRSLLRNLMAHYSFGTPELAGFPADPFARANGASDWVTYGAIDDLKGLGRITACDVPVALLLWNAMGAAYVDVWAARRPPTGESISLDWPLVESTRAQSVAKARFLQFQNQLLDIADLFPTTRARDALRYLPAAGCLPIPPAPGNAIDYFRWFAGCTVRRPAFVEGAQVLSLLKGSLDYPAITLVSPSGTAGTELIWLYLIRENAAVLDGVLPGTSSSGAMLFTTGHMPYAANARFDLARWNYSNYSKR
jgi:hypothetical protein